MLVRTDPFRELDRVASQVFGTTARPAVMPMEAWRDGDTFVIEFDLPAVNLDSVDLDVERKRAHRSGGAPCPTGPEVELIASERPRGVFSRQVILGDALDADAIRATYHSGVLRLNIPVAEKAEPRKIAIASDADLRHAVDA
jgi:HSP20 family protein